MFKDFCIGQNLRVIMLNRVLPNELKKLRPLFQRVFSNERRGTLYSDIWAANADHSIQYTHHRKQTRLPPALSDKLDRKLIEMGLSTGPRVVNLCDFQKSIIFDGVTYSTTSTKMVGNSQIIFGQYPDGCWSAGRISEIFMWSQNAVADTPDTMVPFFLVNVLKSLSANDSLVDYFHRYPVAGRLYYQEYGDESVMLSVEDIVCHFAGIPYHTDELTSRCIHVLPLYR